MLAEPRCTDEFSLVQSDPAYSDGYRLENVFTDDGCDGGHLEGAAIVANYWLLPDGDPGGAGFTLDFGCGIEISVFELRNAQNPGPFDR